MTEVTLKITHPTGLHARPAAAFYRRARQFTSKITIQNMDRPDTGEVAVSTANLMRIGVKYGHHIRLRASGEDEEAAIAELQTMVERNFEEEV